MKLRADLAYIYIKFKSLTQAAKKIDGVQALLPNNITPIKKCKALIVQMDVHISI